MKKTFIHLILFSIVSINAQTNSTTKNQDIKIITVDGNIITGKMMSENDTEVSINTDFGTVSIPRTKIKSIDMVSSNKKFDSKTAVELKQPNTVNTSLNQEARWRTIFSSMILGNTLYGAGIPFILGLDDEKFFTASQLLMFSGGFYASTKYTKNMHLPYGRWQMQGAGAALGFGSIVPLISLIGFDNWSDIDSNGKITMTYLMGMVPFGAIQADKLYEKWDLSNGQASMIFTSVPWGFLNAWGSLFLLYGDNFPESELAWRANFIGIYAATIGAPFLANKYFSNQSLTEDDALFTTFSTGLGFVNSLHVLDLLDGSSVRGGFFLIMGITNGFGYLANRLIKDVDLNKEDWRIIGLGTGAAFLVRAGIGILTGIDNGDKTSLILNMAALNAGWYYTFKKVAKNKNNISYSKPNKKRSSISISPIIMNLSRNPIPGMQIQASFY